MKKPQLLLYIFLFSLNFSFGQMTMEQLHKEIIKNGELLKSNDIKAYINAKEDLNELEQQLIELNNPEFLAHYYHRITIIYKDIYDIQNAKKQLAKMQNVLKGYKNYKYLAKYYNVMFLTNRKSPHVEHYLLKAIEFCNKAKNYDDEQIANINLFRIYLNSKQWQKSLNVSLKSLKTPISEKLKYEYFLYHYINLVVCSLHLKQYEKANLYLIEFEKFHSKSPQKMEQFDYIIYHYYNAKRMLYALKYGKVNKFFEEEAFKYQEILDTNRKTTFLNSLENFKTPFLAQQKMFLEETKAKEKISNYQTIIIVLSLFLIIGLIIFIYFQRINSKFKTQTNKILVSKNDELFSLNKSLLASIESNQVFLQNITHELKTPINTIKGVGFLIENEKNTLDVNLIRTMNFASNHLLKLVNDLLNLGKNSSSSLKNFEFKNFNLKNVVENIYYSFKIDTTNNNELNLILDSSISENLNFDDKKITQVLINLLNNAMKFTNNGTINFIVKLISTENQKQKIYFEVNDTGVGISKDAHELVFQQLAQENENVFKNFGGIGLGLYISKQIIEEFGGKINLESEKNRGTKIWFELVFEISEKLIKQASIELPVTNKKILLVEDNKINQMITKKIIEKRGYFCDTADNGLEATLMVKSNNYSLVLMDLMMPIMDGFEASKKIKEILPNLEIIILSAISDEVDKSDLSKINIKTFLPKPVQPELLYEIVENVV